MIYFTGLQSAKFRWTVGVNKLVPETSFIPANWWKHPHDSPISIFISWFFGQVRRLNCLELCGGGGVPNPAETHVVLR